MGVMSWITSDTRESIPVGYHPEGTFTVYLLQPDGDHIAESNYAGDGIFGGVDAYDWLARMNAPSLCTGDVSHDRDIGIALFFGGNHLLQHPLKFARHPMPYADADPARECPYQGYYFGMIAQLVEDIGRVHG